MAKKNIGLFSNKNFNVMAAIGAVAVLGIMYVVITRKQTVTDTMGTGPMYMGAGFNNPQKLDQGGNPGADDKSNGIEYFTIGNENFKI